MEVVLERQEGGRGVFTLEGWEQDLTQEQISEVLAAQSIKYSPAKGIIETEYGTT